MKNRFFFAACVITLFLHNITFGMQDQENLRNKILLLDRAALGDLFTIQRLISEGVDLNVRLGVSKDTALILAVRNKCEDVVRALIQAGADVNVKNIYGDSALTVAGKGKFVETRDELRRVFTNKQLSIMRMLFEADVHPERQKDFITSAAIQGGGGVVSCSVKMVCGEITRKFISKLEELTKESPNLFKENDEQLKCAFEQTSQRKMEKLLTASISYPEALSKIIAGYAFEPIFELEQQPQQKTCSIQ